MVLLDASALLAYLLNEPGETAVAEALSTKVLMSSVNLTEVVLKLVNLGASPATVTNDLKATNLQVLPYTEMVMNSVLRLNLPARSGLSLADRICLGTALQQNVPVLTADRHWRALKLPVELRLIR